MADDAPRHSRRSFLRGLFVSVAAVAVASRLAPEIPKLELEHDFERGYTYARFGTREMWTSTPISDIDYEEIGRAHTEALLQSMQQRRNEYLMSWEDKWKLL